MMRIESKIYRCIKNKLEKETEIAKERKGLKESEKSEIDKFVIGAYRQTAPVQSVSKMTPCSAALCTVASTNQFFI